MCHTVGYDRFETLAELHLFTSIYAELRLFVNLFQPVEKLIGKTNQQGVIRKHYDQAKTPYQRVLEDPRLADETKSRLRTFYNNVSRVS